MANMAQAVDPAVFGRRAPDDGAPPIEVAIGATISTFELLGRHSRRTKHDVARVVPIPVFARNSSLRRQAAIKVLSLAPDPDAQLLPRFLGEVQAVTQLQHPNIVAALDAGEATSPDGE